MRILFIGKSATVCNLTRRIDLNDEMKLNNNRRNNVNNTILLYATITSSDFRMILMRFAIIIKFNSLWHLYIITPTKAITRSR